MLIKFNCSTCQKALKAPVELIGKVVRCPHCTGRNAVPGFDDFDEPERDLTSSRNEAQSFSSPQLHEKTDHIGDPLVDSHVRFSCSALIQTMKNAITMHRVPFIIAGVVVVSLAFFTYNMLSQDAGSLDGQITVEALGDVRAREADLLKDANDKKGLRMEEVADPSKKIPEVTTAAKTMSVNRSGNNKGKILLKNPKPSGETVFGNKFTTVGYFSGLTNFKEAVIEIKPANGSDDDIVKIGYGTDPKSGILSLTDNQASVKGGLFFFSVPAVINDTIIMQDVGTYTATIRITDKEGDFAETTVNFGFVHSKVRIDAQTEKDDKLPGGVALNFTMSGLDIPGSSGTLIESLEINDQLIDLSYPQPAGTAHSIIKFTEEGDMHRLDITRIPVQKHKRVYICKAKVSFDNPESGRRFIKNYATNAVFTPASDPPRFIDARPELGSLFFTDKVGGTKATLTVDDHSPFIFQFFDRAPGVDPNSVTVSVRSTAPEAKDGWLDVSSAFTITATQARLKEDLDLRSNPVKLDLADPRMRISVAELSDNGNKDQNRKNFIMRYKVVDRVKKNKPVLISAKPIAIPHGVQMNILLNGYNLKGVKRIKCEGLANGREGAPSYTLYARVDHVKSGDHSKHEPDRTIVRIAPPSPGIMRFVIDGVAVHILVTKDRDRHTVERRLRSVIDRDGNSKHDYNDIVDENGKILLPEVKKYLISD